MDGMDFEGLKRAAEARDADALLGFYADDAVLRVMSKATPPGSPLELRGKSAITQYLQDVYARDMSHEIQQEVQGNDRLSYIEACEYPDGTNVVSAIVAEIGEDGKIQSQTIVETWDE